MIECNVYHIKPKHWSKKPTAGQIEIVGRVEYDTLQAELDEAQQTIARLNSEGVVLMAHDVYEVLKQRLERAESLLRQVVRWPKLTEPLIDQYFAENEK